MRSIDDLIDASSLGSAAARRLREATPESTVDQVIERIRGNRAHAGLPEADPPAQRIRRAATSGAAKGTEMGKKILLVRLTSRMRAITADEAVEVLDADDRVLDREHLEIPTEHLADSVEQGDWEGHDHYLRGMAARIRASADAAGVVSVRVLALAEVPHVIALGAHVGNERKVLAHDHNGDGVEWRWPEVERTVELKTVGKEDLTAHVTMAGPAVIRVALSATISDADVEQVVGPQTLADITITHAREVPRRLLIRSLADVEAVRREFRKAYSSLRNARPSVDIIHLFVAAPPSVCLAIGQELNLHNAPPIQTYRYRHSNTGRSQQRAILLSASPDDPLTKPLTEDELVVVARIRADIWPAALTEVETYADNQRADGHDHGPWYASLVPLLDLERVAPYPPLPPLGTITPKGAVVSPEPAAEFFFERVGQPTWKLNDHLLLALERASDGDEARLQAIIRLFLFHEYVHQAHSISSYTAPQLGKFANCLEYLDYTADVYALLHQLDLARRSNGKLLVFEAMREFLNDQIELMLRTFWAFGSETNQWPVRRIRRFLNWYWRQRQIADAQNGLALGQLLARPPKIEIGGLYQVARGPRVIALLDRVDATTHLELGVVVEDEKLFRQTHGPTSDLEGLLAAFAGRRHEDIKRFFRAIYELARDQGRCVQPHPPPASSRTSSRKSDR
jgi:hypothetical protein